MYTWICIHVEFELELCFPLHPWGYTCFVNVRLHFSVHHWTVSIFLRTEQLHLKWIQSTSNVYSLIIGVHVLYNYWHWVMLNSFKISYLPFFLVPEYIFCFAPRVHGSSTNPESDDLEGNIFALVSSFILGCDGLHNPCLLQYPAIYLSKCPELCNNSLKWNFILVNFNCVMGGSV